MIHKCVAVFPFTRSYVLGSFTLVNSVWVKALGCRLHQNKGPDEVKPSASLTLWLNLRSRIYL